MKHYTEEDLILHYYGESADPAQVDRHLADCSTCREQHDAVVELLDTVVASPVPERPADYSTRVWRRLQADLERGTTSGWLARFTWPRLVWAASAAALVLVAFLAGQLTGRNQGIGALTEAQRQLVLMSAVGEHLERSQRMLVDLSNADARGGVDLIERRPVAARLVSANRLYRASASSSGQVAVASLLEQLERVLLEIANGPETMSNDEFNQLWRRIESSALLIKMRIVETESRPRPSSGGRS